MIRLSPTTGLNLYRECPRCFWLHYNKRVQRPRGIFPSLPSGMDLVIKKYFDQYRGSLPPELHGKVEGQLLKDTALMDKWRDWRTGLEYVDQEIGATLFGALDDCLTLSQTPTEGLFEQEVRYIPLDYKTKGSAPRDGDSERYYQTQLDAYALMLNSNGFLVADFAYLIYYYPARVEKNGLVHFNIEPVRVSTSVDRVKKLFAEAVSVLKGPQPKRHENCEYCVWLMNRAEVE